MIKNCIKWGRVGAAARRFSIWSALIVFFAASAATFAPVKAASGALIPICANGSERYIDLETGDEPQQAPEGQSAACHGPCLSDRKRSAAFRV